MRESRIATSQKIFFGFGHVLNDMCASLWFNYLLVYLHSVLQFTNAFAGTLLLIGQVADGISTPIVGMESDAVSCCRWYPRRKSWHLFGSIMVVCSFIFIFNPCLVCSEDTNEWAKFIYFAPIIVIFQIGWAATQIAHLSLIPDLTAFELQRVELTSIRYAFTVMSNFVVFGAAWLLITYMPIDSYAAHPLHDISMKSSAPGAMSSNRSGHNGSWIPVNHDRLSPADIPIFRYLAIILVGVGSLFSLGFHVGVREPNHEPFSQYDESVPVNTDNHTASEDQSNGDLNAHRPTIEQSNTIGADEEESLHIRSTSVFLRMKSSSWLKEPKFYLVGAIYICVRLVTNISLVYMSLYLNDDLMLNKVHVALVPLSIYAISLVTSIIQKKMNKWMGRKITLCTGFIIILGYSASIYFVTRPASLIHLYGTVLLLGIGTSIVMVGSLSLTADMIGNEVKTSAFVYGAMSLGDKFFNGMAVEVIQLIHPCTNCSVKFMWFYRSIEVFFIGIIALIGLALVFLLSFVNVSDLRFYKNPANVTSVNGRVRNYGTVSDQCDSSEEVVYR